MTHEVARADDLDRGVPAESHDLERQQIFAVVRHHEACTGFQGTREYRVVGRVTPDESYVVAPGYHGRQVPKNGHERTDLCVG